MLIGSINAQNAGSGITAEMHRLEGAMLYILTTGSSAIFPGANAMVWCICMPWTHSISLVSSRLHLLWWWRKMWWKKCKRRFLPLLWLRQWSKNLSSGAALYHWYVNCHSLLVYLRNYEGDGLGLAISNRACTDPAAPPPNGSSGSPYASKNKCPTLASQNSTLTGGASGMSAGRFTILLVTLLLICWKAIIHRDAMQSPMY